MDKFQFVISAALAPVAANFLVRPKLLTVTTATMALVQLNWFARYLSAPPIFNRLALLMVGILGIRLCADLLLGRVYSTRLSKSIFRYIVLFSLLFIMLVCASNIYNSESLLFGFYELRYFFFGLVICFSFYVYFYENLSVNTFVKIILFVGYIQFPVSILKWLSAGGGERVTLDSVTGTFATYSEMVACQIIAISVLIYSYLKDSDGKAILNNIICFLVLLTPLLLSKSRTATIYLIVIIFFTWSLTIVKKKKFIVLIRQAVPVVVFVIIVLAVLYNFFWKMKGYDLEQQFNLNYVYGYYMREPIEDYNLYLQGADTRMGRLRAISTATSLVAEDFMHFFVGYGSGASANAAFLNKAGTFYQEYGRYSGLGRNHYSKTIVELGFLGLFLFLMFLVAIYQFIKRNSIASQPDIKSIAILLLFSILVLSMYAHTLSSFYFSFALGLFFASSQAEFDKTINNQNNVYD